MSDSLIWYCQRCGKIVKSKPPQARACTCKTPVISLTPTRVIT